MTLSKLFLPCWLGALILLSGCSTLAPRKDVSRFYTLDLPPVASAEQGANASAPLLSEKEKSELTVIGLLMPQLPAYLERPQIVERKQSGEVRILDNHRWAEPLDEAVLRVLGHALKRAFASDPDFQVVAFPHSNQANTFLQVRLQSFEPDTTGKVQLVAHWSLRAENAQGAFKEAEVRLQTEWETDDYASLALAMSRLLVELAEAIQMSIRQ